MNIQPTTANIALQNTLPANPKGETASNRDTTQAISSQPPAAAPLTSQFVPGAENSEKAQNASRDEVQGAAQRISDFVAPLNDSIQFSVDDKSGEMVIKVIDRETDEVLRQIPSEEALNIANALDKLQGLLIKSQA